MRDVWIEFKTIMLPWLLASAVIGLFIYENHRLDVARDAEVSLLRQTISEQTRAVEGFKALLAEQGYVAPPMDGNR